MTLLPLDLVNLSRAVFCVSASSKKSKIRASNCHVSWSEGRARLRAFPRHCGEEKNTQLSPFFTPRIGSYLIEVECQGTSAEFNFINSDAVISFLDIQSLNSDDTLYSHDLSRGYPPYHDHSP